MMSDQNLKENEQNKDLEELLSKISDTFHNVISNGYHQHKVNIPVLDPLSDIPNITKHLDVKRSHVDITINKPIIRGLSGIELVQKPKLNLSDRSINFKLSFSKLSFESEEFKANGTYKILFKHHVDKEGYLKVDASGVIISMNLALDVDQNGPSVKANGSKITINNLNVDIDDSTIIDLLIPFFKHHIEQALCNRLESTLEQLFTSKLQGIYSAQKPIFDKLVKLYQMKKEQGFDIDIEGNPEKPRVLEGFGGVGQLPLPLFWKLPSVDVEHLEHINMDELKNRVSTGDIVLFSGALASSQKIRRYTQSAFSHVTFIVKEDEFLEAAPLIWQSTSSTHRGVLRNMQYKSGIQLNHMEEMIHDYLKECPGSTVVYRSLNRQLRDQALEQEKWQEVVKLIHKEDGNPYTDDMDGLYIMGLTEIDDPKKDDYFCAGLVAQSMMNYGILKNTFVQYQYAPRDFSHVQQALPFALENTSFGPEIVVDV